MKKSVAEIIADVALMSGFHPLSLIPEESEQGDGLEKRIRLEIEEAAADAILSAPAASLAGWHLLPATGLALRSGGGKILPLPDDFLRLHSLRMSDWEEEETAPAPSPGWLSPLSYSLTEEGKRAVVIMATADNSTIASGWYMSRPEIEDTDEIEIPVAVYPGMLRLICRRINEAE